MEGESLSSWRLRAGSANGFFRYPLGPNEGRGGDPDLVANTDSAAWLEEAFLLEAESLRDHCLDRFHGALFEDSTRLANFRWVIPSKFTATKFSIAGAYCPACLQDDPVPYFRLAWRMAYVTHCTKHQCLLQEGCPHCGASVWPVAYRERTGGQTTPFECFWCVACDSDLRHVQAVSDQGWETSSELWSASIHNQPPPQAPEEANATSYFLALWLLSRLVRKRLEVFTPHLPENLVSAYQSAGRHAGRRIEYLPATQRTQILGVATWLLEEWPGRFIETGQAAGLAGTEFLRGELAYPVWFEKVLRQHFLKKTNWVGHSEVSEAVNQLKTAGTIVTKNALRRTLNLRENWVINELLDQRRHATIDELAALGREFEQTLAHTPTSRDQQRTLLRDFLILLVSAFAGCRIEVVCAMTRKDVIAVIGNAKTDCAGTDSDSRSYLLDLLIRLNELYTQGVRPEFLVRGLIADPWFLSRFGKAIAGHSIRERIAKMMRKQLDASLWNSADVFLATIRFRKIE